MQEIHSAETMVGMLGNLFGLGHIQFMQSHYFGKAHGTTYEKHPDWQKYTVNKTIIGSLAGDQLPSSLKSTATQNLVTMTLGPHFTNLRILLRLHLAPKREARYSDHEHKVSNNEEAQKVNKHSVLVKTVNHGNERMNYFSQILSNTLAKKEDINDTTISNESKATRVDLLHQRFSSSISQQSQMVANSGDVLHERPLDIGKIIQHGYQMVKFQGLPTLIEKLKHPLPSSISSSTPVPSSSSGTYNLGSSSLNEVTIANQYPVRSSMDTPLISKTCMWTRKRIKTRCF
ncbi:uncharacterized protein BX664DRAFT_348972 [Halteromyces radiatus]|uniref:uncharacterized protein n=1 Tax=Halteromyces radiatus TaxID=101107 RepID=UPI00221E52EF|nr:uncharacterized protein BX664DRAFT_348972 [Halteromyces radiatus]KAI8093784.1 hypothetical protein BX664DRAFT_348972 [Halteromyces radiatus]